MNAAGKIFSTSLKLFLQMWYVSNIFILNMFLIDFYVSLLQNNEVIVFFP